MSLNDRKIKILEAVVNDYIATGEPIGSRTIAKKYDLGISSATIRNEMSDLEELGLIIQPHTSAGRVPSDKGYRLYADRLVKLRELTKEEEQFFNQLIANNINQIDYLMQQTAKAIATMTNYTTIVTEPIIKKIKINHLQLVAIDDKSLVAVVVTDTKAVKNFVIRCDCIPQPQVLYQISSIINEALKSFDVDYIKNSVIKDGEKLFGENKKLVITVLENIFQNSIEENDIHFYTSGVRNILGFPEFNDIEKAKSFFQAIEEKDMIISLLNSSDVGEDVKIMIGNENNIEQMKDCSIIKANYKIDDDSIGTIGIIGPKRMDYAQTVSVLNGIVKSINVVIKLLSGG